MAHTVAALQTDLARTDGKANLLLALTGAALVAVLTVAAGRQLPLPAKASGAAGAAMLLAATVLLLLAVRPVLAGGGWTSWSALDPEELRARLVSGYEAEHLRFMAVLATRKFRLIRAAVDCMLVGVVLLAVSAVLVGLD
ncbi:hypothetical protein HUT18_26175 [Streptomyces sp. NA04227]|nr:hypothetical protein HUT18_26175 [Streptomyces sp. NA04227]